MNMSFAVISGDRASNAEVFMKSLIAVLLCSVLLPGCATILEGTSQSVTVATDPSGSDCVLERKGTRIGQVNPTPGSIHIDKSKDDLSISCKRPGYQAATIVHSSKFQGTTFGNILLGGLVGIIADASSGANFSYPPDVKVTLAPEEQPSASPPVASMTTAPATPVSYKSIRQ